MRFAQPMMRKQKAIICNSKAERERMGIGSGADLKPLLLTQNPGPANDSTRISKDIRGVMEQQNLHARKDLLYLKCCFLEFF